MKDLVQQELFQRRALLADLGELTDEIAQGAEWIVDALSKGNKLLLCGNGGSAADAQHIAAEFVGRFVFQRRPLPAIALTTDTSILTSIGNDYGFEAVFQRQVAALARPGDVLIAISTSGSSPNVLSAVREAHRSECKVIGLSGRAGGALREVCDLCLVVRSDVTAFIQEMHATIGHIWCAAADSALAVE
jgi:D-sedoheptulose 7-phosphate isomerase